MSPRAALTRLKSIDWKRVWLIVRTVCVVGIAAYMMISNPFWLAVCTASVAAPVAVLPLTGATARVFAPTAAQLRRRYRRIIQVEECQ